MVDVDHRCSGVLVSPDLVLFAHHCGIEVEYIYVGNGPDDAVSVEVIECWGLEGGAPGNGRDFAACRLETGGVELPFVPLARSAPDLDEIETVYISGFGEDEAGTVGRKRYAQATVSGRTSVGDWAIGGGGVDGCRGDSGGPALATLNGRPQVIGVLSFGHACGDGGYYGSSEVAWNWLTDDIGLGLPRKTAGIELSDTGPKTAGGWLSSCEAPRAGEETSCAVASTPRLGSVACALAYLFVVAGATMRRPRRHGRAKMTHGDHDVDEGRRTAR